MIRYRTLKKEVINDYLEKYNALSDEELKSVMFALCGSDTSSLEYKALHRVLIERLGGNNGVPIWLRCQDAPFVFSIIALLVTMVALTVLCLTQLL